MIVARTRLSVLTSIKKIMQSIPSYAVEARTLQKDLFGASLSDFAWMQYGFEYAMEEHIVEWIAEEKHGNPDLEGRHATTAMFDYSLPEALDKPLGNDIDLEFTVRLEAPQNESFYTAYVSEVEIRPSRATIAEIVKLYKLFRLGKWEWKEDGSVLFLPDEDVDIPQRRLPSFLFPAFHIDDALCHDVGDVYAFTSEDLFLQDLRKLSKDEAKVIAAAVLAWHAGVKLAISPSGDAVFTDNDGDIFRPVGEYEEGLYAFSDNTAALYVGGRKENDGSAMA